MQMGWFLHGRGTAEIRMQWVTVERSYPFRIVSSYLDASYPNHESTHRKPLLSIRCIVSREMESGRKGFLMWKDCMPSRLEVNMFRSSWYSSYGVAVLPTIRCIWCRCHGSMIRSHYHHALSFPHFVCCTSSTTWKRLSIVLAMMGYGDVNRPSMRYHPRICFIACYDVYRCHYA